MKPGLVVYALLLSVTIVLAGSCSSVSTSDTPTVVKLDVTYSGTAIFDGNAYIPGFISGGNTVNLSIYQPGGGGPGGGGWWVF